MNPDTSIDADLIDVGPSADFPTSACGSDGFPVAAWTEILEDKLIVRNLEGPETILQADRPTGPLSLVQSPDGGRTVVAWQERGAVVWQQMQGQLKPGNRERIAGSDAAACFDSLGRLRRIWRRGDGRLVHCIESDSPIEVGGFDARRCACAPGPDGCVVAIWDDAAGDALGVFLAVIDSGGRLADGPHWLTRGLRVNWSPTAAADPAGRVWIAWENCRTNIVGRSFHHHGGKAALALEDTTRLGGHGYRIERCILGALWNTGTLRWLGGVLGDSPLPIAMHGVKPALAAEATGGVFLARQSLNRDRLWDTYIQRLSDGAESQPMRIASGGGPTSRRVGLCAAPDGVLHVACQQCRGEEHSRTSHIVLVRTEGQGHWAVAAKPISRPIELSAPPLLESPQRYRTKFGERDCELYFGDLHMHSEVSGCSRVKDGTVREVLDFARHGGGLDFAAPTDHSNEFTEYDWACFQETIQTRDQPGVFVAMLAYEFVITDDRGLYFHRQVIYRDTEGPLLFMDNDERIRSNRDIWNLIGDRAIFTVLHQTGDSRHQGQFDDHDERYQPVMEIFQARGSYEKWDGRRWPWENRWSFYADAPDAPQPFGRIEPETWLQKTQFVQNALARGLVFGFTGGGEHEGVGFTGVFAESLTREAIFDAVEARRCYATTGAKIVLDVRMAGEPMGSFLDKIDEPVLSIRMIGTAPLSKITIVKDNADVHVFDPAGQSEGEFEWRDNGEPSEPNWRADHHCYYVRLEQVDGHMAWSSPIFVAGDK